MDPYQVVNWMIKATNTTPGADVAEMYYTTDDTIDAGTVVSLDSNILAGVRKTIKAYEKNVLGIISTKPAILIGDDTNSGRAVNVAMIGRVPVKVTTANGQIKAGDAITSSDIAGVGMKATKAGYIVGTAIQDYTSANPEEVGSVIVFINQTWYDPDVYLTDTGDVSVTASDSAEMEYTVKKGNDIITRIGMFAELVIGKLKAGIIRTDNLYIKDENVGEVIAKLKDSNEKLASEAAFLRSIVLGASISGTLTETIENLDVNNDAIIGNNLTILGRTTLANLGVTGTMTAGVITLDGLNGEINSAGEPLKIQSLAASPVEIMNGKVKIETNGNMTVKGILTADEVKTEKVSVKTETASSSAVLTTSAGQISIPVGTTSIDVSTSALTTNSLVFTTPDAPIAVGTKKIDANTFRIILNAAQPVTVKVNWWLIN